MSHTFLYVRVSTDDQCSAHQAAQAAAAGFQIDEVITDHGVSGVNTLFKDRPGGARLLDKVRSGDTLVIRWVDRLGRNYEDVVTTIRTLMTAGVVVRTVINNMTFNGATTDPMEKAIRDAMIAFMAASAQAQAEATKISQKAGIQHARTMTPEKYRGRRPSFTRDQLTVVLERSQLGDSVTEIATAAAVSRQTVYRIQDNPAAASAALQRWGG
jgi:DNA invertase Pin-like site-specific DNA recombinase